MKNVDHVFKSELTKEEKDNCIALFGSEGACSIEQHPDWDQIASKKRKPHYFLMKRENKLVAYSVIHFPQGKVAHVPFGPIFIDREIAVEAIKRIIEHFKKERFFYLTIQLPGPSDHETEFIEYKINKDYEVKYVFDKRNWSSSVIKLDDDVEEIIKGFASNHRWSVRKAKKQGVSARVINTEAEIEKFNEIYLKMYKSRGYDFDAEENLNLYKRMLDFFKDEKNGFFYAGFHEDEMIGGFIVLLIGKRAVYHHAATDPDKRKIPMQHLAIGSVLELLKEKGITQFDLGGYNHMVGKEDQIYHINKFKDGFTKDYVFFPKLMHIEYMRGSIKMLGAFQRFKDIVKKVVGR